MTDSAPLCVSCGVDRSDNLLDDTNTRRACACGERAVVYKKTFNVTMTLSASLTTSLVPGLQDRDWKMRWDQLHRSLADLTAGRTEARSSAATHSAAQDLFDFFIAAYHLKDALKADGVVVSDGLEHVITHNPTLALLCDLANLDKHRKLTKPPRSGAVPVVDRIADESSGESWQLVVKIEHAGRQLDGLAFASQALAEWDELLSDEGLI